MLSGKVAWQAKAGLVSAIWFIMWLPKSVIHIVQRCFDTKDVVFCFDAKKVAKAGAGKPLVALTIDDSPALEFDARPAEVCSTSEIRKLLMRFQARASFFIIGSHVTHDRQALLRALHHDGHELCNHGMHDRPAFRLPAEEFAKDVDLAQAIVEECGGRKRWFRPSHALFTPWKLAWLRQNGYRLALGNVYPHDAFDLPPWQWSYPRILSRLLITKAQAGDVIIIHDRPWTPAVLALALPVLTARFTVCTLSELADACEGCEHALTWELTSDIGGPGEERSQLMLDSHANGAILEAAGGLAPCKLAV